MQSEVDMLLAQSEERIAALKDDLRLEERLRERLLAIRSQRPSLGTSVQMTNNGGNGSGAGAGQTAASGIMPGSLTSHVIAVLEEAGHSLKAREIAERVMARGYTTTAKGGVPVAVSTTLAHDSGKVFQKVSYGVYDLKSRQEAAPQEGGQN